MSESGAEPGERRRLLAEFMEGLPQARALGLRVIRTGEGAAELGAPYAAELVGDPATGVIHGGVVTTLLDTCCGLAVMVSAARPNSTATLDLRIDYMRPATPGQEIVARAEVHRTTRSVAFVRAAAYDDDAGRPVATAAGAFMLENGS